MACLSRNLGCRSGPSTCLRGAPLSAQLNYRAVADCMVTRIYECIMLPILIGLLKPRLFEVSSGGTVSWNGRGSYTFVEWLPAPRVSIGHTAGSNAPYWSSLSRMTCSIASLSQNHTPAPTAATNLILQGCQQYKYTVLYPVHVHKGGPLHRRRHTRAFCLFIWPPAAAQSPPFPFSPPRFGAPSGVKAIKAIQHMLCVAKCSTCHVEPFFCPACTAVMESS